MKVKTRFAPSPTGNLHIGSIRTALYSWLFARHFGGDFVLRIENTDLSRSKSEIIRNMIYDMQWLNFDWDEGPYLQTERFSRYQKVIDEMLKTGKAYKCFCTKDRIKALREAQIKHGKKSRYDGYCRYNNKYYAIGKELPYVVRFANPQQGSVVFNDKIHGTVEFSNLELDDLIIRRIDGSPTYNLCVVVDDWDMAITHVIRGEDHLNNTPKQINIIKALNAPLPVYAHVPMINNHCGEKLSKRNNEMMSIMQYRNLGYLPEAILNYLVRLGWSNGNQEIFSRDEMIKFFSLEKVHKSPSTLNITKLMWLNHYYINNLPLKYIETHLQQHFKQANINIKNGPELSKLIKLFGKRCKTLKEMVEKHRYFYEEFSEFENIAAEKYLRPIAYDLLKMIRDKIATINNWTTEHIQFAIKETADELKVEIQDLGMPLRVAVTGVKQSPALDITIHTIGKIRSLRRIDKALNFIDKLRDN